MLKNIPVKPEDILADGVDTTMINGRTVRKGSIAAFLANADILLSSDASESQKQEAINMMETLAPAVIAIGLRKHVTFKNPQVEQILSKAEYIVS